MRAILTWMLILLSFTVSAATVEDHFKKILTPTLPKTDGMRHAVKNINLCRARGDLGFSVAVNSKKIPIEYMLEALKTTMENDIELLDRYEFRDIRYFISIIKAGYRPFRQAAPEQYAADLLQECLDQKNIVRT